MKSRTSPDNSGSQQSRRNSQLRIYIFVERMWLVGCAIGVIAMAVFLLMKDNDSALYFFAFFILASLLYLLRKRQRVRFQKQLESPPPPAKK